MKISNIGSGKAATPTGRKKRASTSTETDFADELKETVNSPAAGGLVQSPVTGPVDAILAVQEVPDSTEERSRGLVRQYGDDLLDRLEKLRRDVLTGIVPKEGLADLAHALRLQRGKADDPRLNDIIKEIELRAKVEIAKLTRDV